MTPKKILVLLLLAGLSLSLAGCSAAQKQKIEETDQWIRENMW